MRILYVYRNFATGGPVTLLLTLLEGLAARGFGIVTATYDTPHAADAEFTSIMRTHGFALCPQRIPWRGWRDFFVARRAIQHIAEQQQATLIHTHDNQSNKLVGMSRRALPRIASAYGWWEANVKLRAYYAIERRLALPNFDRVYTVSNDLRDKIVAAGTAPERVAVIYSGIDTKRFEQRNLRGRIRTSLGIADDALVLGTISRLSSEKGHENLLKALPGILAHVPRAHVLIVGDGPDRQRLERMVDEQRLRAQVTFTGFYDDLPAAMEAMDMVVLPSVLAEGLPTSILESQAAGLPAIASDLGGTREALCPEKTGVLVPPGDVKALSNAVLRLASNEQERQLMGEQARARIEQCFSVPSMIERMGDLYRDVLNVARH